MGNGMKVSSTDIQGLQAQPTSIHIMARWSLRTASPEDLLQLVTCLLLSMIFHLICTIYPALDMLARFDAKDMVDTLNFFKLPSLQLNSDCSDIASDCFSAACYHGLSLTISSLVRA
jgi:hypothetical protein